MRYFIVLFLCLFSFQASAQSLGLGLGLGLSKIDIRGRNFLRDSDGRLMRDSDGFLIRLDGETKFDDRLTWSPSVLTNPTIVTVENSDTPGNIITTISRSPYTSPSVTETSNSVLKTISLTATEDVEMYFPCDEVVEATSIVVTRARQINLIGGSLKALTDATASIRALLRFAGQSKRVYVEGVLFDLDHKLGLDALEIGATSGLDPFAWADYTVQNSACINGGIANTYHSDCIQPYGHTKSVRLDKYKTRSQYQGWFFDPQWYHSGFDMRRVDSDYVDPTVDETLTGYICYLHYGAPDAAPILRPSFVLGKVYCGRRETSYGVAGDGYWSEYSIYPKASLAYGADVDVAEPNSRIATFPSFPEITGYLTKGNPPVTIVDESAIGLNYVPIGYK